MAVNIVPVTSKAQQDIFLKMPWHIYSDDPHWVPPLIFERRQHLSKKNPYFEHARFKQWLAMDGDQCVGRITAQVDELHLKTHQDATGFFGFIEADDNTDVFEALLQTAEQWLKSQGMKRIQGPFSLGINDESGLLVEGFDSPPIAMMGHNPAYYAPRIESCGYGKAMDLLAYAIDTDFTMPEAAIKAQKRYSKRVNIRPLNKKDLANELKILREIFNDAWSENWNYVPFTEAEFARMGKDMAMIVPPDMIQIAELKGDPVAMIVMLPNIHEHIHDLNGSLLPLNWLKLLWRLKMGKTTWGRTVLMGVRKEHQNSLLGAALCYGLIDRVVQGALKQKISRAELSWILETNKPMRNVLESLGAKIYKRYRVFEKSL